MRIVLARQNMAEWCKTGANWCKNGADWCDGALLLAELDRIQGRGRQNPFRGVLWVFEIRHVEKLIDGRSVLTIEALDIEPGEVVAAIGPAGTGKSLLIALLAGVLPPSGGK